MQGLTRQRLALDDGQPASFSSILFTETQRFAFTSDRKRFLAEDQMNLGASGVRVSRVRSSGHRIALDEKRDVTFLFPRSGTLAVRVAGRTFGVDSGAPAFFRPHPRDTTAIAPGGAAFEGHVLMLPAAEIEDLAARAGVRHLAVRDTLRLQGPSARRLGCEVAFLVDQIDTADSAPLSDRAAAAMTGLTRDLIASWLSDVAADLFPGNRAQVAVDAARVRKAEDIMREHLDQPLSMVDLARELDISLRSLQLAFQSIHGEGPRARLNRIRLEAARVRLTRAAPPESVTSIALDAGFTHLGRFAEAYQRAFGERPSETLSRGIAPSGRR